MDGFYHNVLSFVLHNTRPRANGAYNIPIQSIYKYSYIFGSFRQLTYIIHNLDYYFILTKCNMIGLSKHWHSVTQHTIRYELYQTIKSIGNGWRVNSAWVNG